MLKSRCPLNPRKRTFVGIGCMSAKGINRDAVQPSLIACVCKSPPWSCQIGTQPGPVKYPARASARSKFTLFFTPDGKTLYVSGGANLLVPIRISNNHLGTPIVVGVSPNAIAFAILRRCL
jgi:hypothetical protein